MATLVEIDGKFRIQFVNPVLGKRTILYSGIPSRQKKKATDLKVRVERLVDALAHEGRIDRESEAWVATLGPDLRAKLERLQLVQSDEDRPRTLGQLIATYLEKRKGSVEQATYDKWENAARLLKECFPEGKALPTFKTADGQDFRDWMLRQRKGLGGEPYSESHVRKTCGIASQMFRYGIERNALSVNPFTTVPKRARRSLRLAYIPWDVFEKVLEAAPDEEFKCILALVRIAGLRHPSETYPLTWADFNFETGMFRILSKKTKRQGKAWRECPIFSELRPFLLAIPRERCPTDHVVQVHRLVSNRKRLAKVIKEAKVDQWSRLFQNLRASADTDLCRKYPIAAVAAWLGHTPQVALANYLQATEADARRAAGIEASNAPDNAQAPAEPDNGKP